ncbi:MAG: acyl-CoA dehydrogenase family protein [Polyangiaceae bacterium]|nr:acyl-CoA dehydrogenase family protein [Polyangiaceae bacterium]
MACRLQQSWRPGASHGGSPLSGGAPPCGRLVAPPLTGAPLRGTFAPSASLRQVRPRRLAPGCPLSLDLSLTESQQLIQRTAREFAERRVAPRASELDREAAFPEELVRGLAELGLLGVNVRQEFGGAEAGALAYSLAMTEIARACASTAVTMAVTNMVGEVIQAFGDDAQRAHHLPLLTSGAHLTGAFALSEPAVGSDAAKLTTIARRDGDTYVLDGQKQWITNGAHAGVIVVWARTGGPGPRGISCFLVERGAAGLVVGRAEDKHGLRGSNTVPLTFDACRVPASCRLGEEGVGFRIAMMALDGGRIGIASQSIGIATAGLEAATRYAKERVAFGRPLAEHQAVQFMLADSAAELDAARMLTWRAATLKDRGDRFTQEASMAKLYASEAANRVCNRAMQVLGGYGYVRDFPVERHLRDVRITTIYEGTSEIQRMVIARGLLE